MYLMHPKTSFGCRAGSVSAPPGHFVGGWFYEWVKSAEPDPKPCRKSTSRVHRRHPRPHVLRGRGTKMLSRLVFASQDTAQLSNAPAARGRDLYGVVPLPLRSRSASG